MFQSPCFYAPFEVSHQKQVMETPYFGKKNPLICKKNFYEVVFDLCDKGLMQMGDRNGFCE